MSDVLRDTTSSDSIRLTRDFAGKQDHGVRQHRSNPQAPAQPARLSFWHGCRRTLGVQSKEAVILNEAATMHKPKQKFEGIDAVRGIAACMVVFYHTGRRIAEPRFYGEVPFGGLLNGFNVGVDCFFVLSGFLIAWVHWRDIGVPARIPNYARRRFSRIYPVYWTVLTFLIVTHLVHPAITNPIPLTFQTITTSYLLMPNDGPSLLGVAWTLYFEVTYYVIFGLLLWVGRIGFVALALWASAIVVSCLMGPRTGFPGVFFLDPCNLEFMAGMATAALLRNRTLPAPKVIATVASVLFVGIAAFNPSEVLHEIPLVDRIVFGLLACGIIAGLVEAERSRRFVVPAWAKALGAASYSIYLVHTIVQPPFLQFASGLILSIGANLATIATAVFSIVIGYIFHLMVERPLTVQVRTIVGDHKAISTASSA